MVEAGHPAENYHSLHRGKRPEHQGEGHRDRHILREPGEIYRLSVDDDRVDQVAGDELHREGQRDGGDGSPEDQEAEERLGKAHRLGKAVDGIRCVAVDGLVSRGAKTAHGSDERLRRVEARPDRVERLGKGSGNGKMAHLSVPPHVAAACPEALP